MKKRPFRAYRSFYVLLAAMFLLLPAANSEIPDEFKKLEVFPKDIAKRDLIDSMKKISGALGVRCDFCHEMKTPGDFDSIDWPSEKIAHKQVARDMMLMAREINSKLLPQPAHGETSRVTCYTCHRGLPEPTTLSAAIQEATGEGGIDAGIAKYRELRESYYGSGSFDFGASALMGVAETYAQEKSDLESALALMDLAVEMDPDFARNYLMRAQIHAQKGESGEAKKDLDKVLEMDPENQHAKRMLDQLEP